MSAQPVNPNLPPDHVTVFIDGVELAAPKGSMIIQVADRAGIPIPRFCYHSKLAVAANCRMCLVEVEKMPKPAPACATPVMDGMKVYTRSDKALRSQRNVMEFLLINHPLDCPICDQAGECHLQDLSYEHGKAGTRYEFKRRTFEKHDLGPYIQLHMTRCILCYRCVFVADQLTEKRVHGVLDRGDHAQIATYIEKALDNDFIGNVIDVCPVGALTDRTFRFKNRVWFLKPVDAHRDCPKCAGKVTLWYRGDEVFRVTARKDYWGEVHDWICNECRFEKKKTSDWVIEGPTNVSRHSVISANHYVKKEQPKELLPEIIGRNPKLLMDIHDVSEVNKPTIHLSALPGPAHSDDFNNNGVSSK